jgi:hypothetical protein
MAKQGLLNDGLTPALAANFENRCSLLKAFNQPLCSQILDDGFQSLSALALEHN